MLDYMLMAGGNPNVYDIRSYENYDTNKMNKYFDSASARANLNLNLIANFSDGGDVYAALH